jgi:hypothetical protein
MSEADKSLVCADISPLLAVADLKRRLVSPQYHHSNHSADRLQQKTSLEKSRVGTPEYQAPM